MASQVFVFLVSDSIGAINPNDFMVSVAVPATKRRKLTIVSNAEKARIETERRLEQVIFQRTLRYLSAIQDHFTLSPIHRLAAIRWFRFNYCKVFNITKETKV